MYAELPVDQTHFRHNATFVPPRGGPRCETPGGDYNQTKTSNLLPVYRRPCGSGQLRPHPPLLSSPGAG